MSNTDEQQVQQPPERPTTTPGHPYETPTIHDFGALSTLTLSGSGALSDAFGGAAGGGS